MVLSESGAGLFRCVCGLVSDRPCVWSAPGLPCVSVCVCAGLPPVSFDSRSLARHKVPRRSCECLSFTVARIM